MREGREKRWQTFWEKEGEVEEGKES
jgi:hypothetical protein